MAEPEGFSVEIKNSNPGLLVIPLREALKTQQKIIKEHLEAMNLNALSDGVLIHIPDGKKHEDPVYGFLDFKTSKSNAEFFPRTLIELAPHSQALYIEECRGESPELALWNHAAELILREEACLSYIVINRLGPKFKSLCFESANLAPGAKLQIFHLNLGSEHHRVEIKSDSWGENSRLEILGSVYGENRQDVSACIKNQQKAAHTKLHILWKSALRNESKSSFLAEARIAKEANGSEVLQACHNLLLSRKASARPEPRLEILSNNVKAKHASTVGYLNPEEKFYLASRGLDEAEAEKLMTLGFLAEPMKYLSPTLNQFLEEKLREAIYKGDEDSKNLFN